MCLVQALFEKRAASPSDQQRCQNLVSHRRLHHAYCMHLPNLLQLNFIAADSLCTFKSYSAQYASNRMQAMCCSFVPDA